MRYEMWREYVCAFAAAAAATAAGAAALDRPSCVSLNHAESAVDIVRAFLGVDGMITKLGALVVLLRYRV